MLVPSYFHVLYNTIEEFIVD